MKRIVLGILLFMPFSWAKMELSILSWNLMLLPRPVSLSNQDSRTLEIIKKIQESKQEVIIFQELFMEDKLELIKKELANQYPYQVTIEKQKKFYKLANSGLLGISKYPFEVLEYIYFNDCSPFMTDCLSSKGAILIELKLPQDKKLQLVLTHMQSGPKDSDQGVRIKQLDQIKAMLNRHIKTGVAQVLAGDFNIDANIENKAYINSLNFMNMESTPLTGTLNHTFGFRTDCFKTLPTWFDDETEQWIDHAWINTQNSTAKITEQSVLPLIGVIKNKSCPLSDHYGLNITLSI